MIIFYRLPRRTFQAKSLGTRLLPGMFRFRHPWLAYFWHRKLSYQYERECYPFQSERENKKIKKMLSNLWKIIIYMYNIKIICPLKNYLSVWHCVWPSATFTILYIFSIRMRRQAPFKRVTLPNIVLKRGQYVGSISCNIAQ
jgi:hypothetical protein